MPAALIVFRLRGAYFAIGTWVVAEVCRLVLAQVKQLGGGTGTSLPTDVAGAMLGLEEVRELFAVRGPAARTFSPIGWPSVLAAGTFMLVYRLLRSRYGLALSAIGDAEAAAESAGVDVFGTKLLIYVVTAIATAWWVHSSSCRGGQDLAHGSSLIDWTAYVIFIVVIGGIGSMEGPVIGVLIFYLLQYYLAALGSWYLIILGALRHSAHAVCSVRRLGRDLAHLRHQPVPGAAEIDRAGRQGEAEGRRGVRRTRGFFREWGLERKGGIMVTEFGKRIPVEVAAKYDDTSAEALLRPLSRPG